MIGLRFGSQGCLPWRPDPEQMEIRWPCFRKLGKTVDEVSIRQSSLVPSCPTCASREPNGYGAGDHAPNSVSGGERSGFANGEQDRVYAVAWAITSLPASAVNTSATPEVIRLTPTMMPRVQLALEGHPEMMIAASARSAAPLAIIQPHEFGITSR